MRLLVFSTNGAIRDGITSWTIQTFERMDKSRLEVVDTIAFEGTDATIIDQLEVAGLRTHILPSRRKHLFAYMRALRRTIREQKYDAVHINGNSATVAIELLCCLGTGVPARIVHSRNTQGDHRALDKALRPIMNMLGTDRIACGRDAGRWLFGDQDFLIVPNGRDLDTYSFDETVRTRVRNELGVLPDSIVVGHVGNLTRQKNHRFLLEVFADALRQESRLRLLLIGDGSLREELEREAHTMKIDYAVIFVGRTTRVPEYLNAFDLAVLPSLYEGFPNVVIEWQANGLPSLVSSTVTDECAVTDLVTHLPAEDTTSWTEAILSMPTDKRLTRSNSARDELRAAGYEAQESATKLSTLYATIERRQNTESGR